MKRVFVAVAIFVTVIPLVIYGYFFGKSGISTDVGNWGAFGDYVGGLLNPIFAALNLCVLVYLATYVESLKTEKEMRSTSLQLAFDLEREWHSKDMYESREKTYEYFKSNHTLTAQNIADLEKAVGRRSSDLKHYYAVLGFFDRLHTMNKKGFISDEHLCEVFGSVFTWWDAFSFERHLPATWRSHKKVQELRGVIKNGVEAQQLNEWKKHAETYK